jgi:2',3'-cyclic-nucleotide 2'-phosphodiesterase (5'-nucleotidase family)
MPSHPTRGRVRLAALAAVGLAAAGLQLVSAPDAHAAPTVDIQILATNDFHGRIQNDTGSLTAGAAVLAGAVKQLRVANPNTVFAAAGDLIGASTFESFIAHDKPTIDALNEAGLEVSSVGNHEFDQGYNDLVNRVMATYNATTNPFGGASWKYLGANVRFKSSNNPALPRTWTKTFGTVKVGFVGAVTEHLPELVSPGGIADIKVTDVVDEVNSAADNLKANGADVVIMLVHEGAPMTDCNQIGNLGPETDFGSIITGVDDNVDAIVSGHTHLEYNCHFPVAGWDGRPVTERPVVSAGQYGMALNQLVFTVDEATGEVVAQTQSVLRLKAANAGPFNYPVDGPTDTIVQAAVANAAVLGAVKLGNLGGPFFRGKLADGTTENRGAESTLGNLVAEVQKWATRNPESGSAQIAFMNPGGLRQDMTGSGAGAFPRDLTYQQAAVVQPFANTLVNMDLTGAQIKTVLEQQWQPGGASRPFLKLGISKGFTYTFDDTRPAGSRITGMWQDGTPIVPATVYSVTVNSFLATGGDNFLELNNGANKQDTGQTDLQAMVAYMAAFGAGANTVAPSFAQNGVGVAFPAGAPASYAPGAHVKFDVSSWSMTNALDTKDTAVTVKLGSATLGTATLDNAALAAPPGFDTVGKASVDVVLPAGTPGGPTTLTLVGTDTGTSIAVPITVTGSGGGGGTTKLASTASGKVKPGKPRVGHKVRLTVSVTAPNGSPATGQVTVKVKGQDAVTVALVNGEATVKLGKFAKRGKKSVAIGYLGSTTLLPSSATVTFRVRAQH